MNTLRQKIIMWCICMIISAVICTPVFIFATNWLKDKPVPSPAVCDCEWPKGWPKQMAAIVESKDLVEFYLPGRECKAQGDRVICRTNYQPTQPPAESKREWPLNMMPKHSTPSGRE